MFEGFTREQIKTKETTINLVRGGSGDPVLLLHGYPQTHACWHMVAPRLAEKFTVVCPDLRGSGDSGKPPGGPAHVAYSKRAMAADQVEVMQSLGFDKFAVAGHDRGARAAHRMALDHADKITKLALLDIIPTSTAFAKTDKEIATAAFNWFFSIQPDGLPEKLIGAEPSFYLQYLLDHWRDPKKRLAPEAVAEYHRCFDAEMIRATNEEFRRAATIDLEHDDADKEKKISCPLFLLWSSSGMWAQYDIMNIWREKAVDVQGKSLDCGHFLPEEAPDETAEALLRFIADDL